MQQRNGQKENATSNTQNNANETHNKDSNLVKRKQIEGTPFHIIKNITDNDKERYFLVMGDYRITEPTETEKETLDKLVTEYWKIVINVIAIATQTALEVHDKKTQQPYELESL